MTCPGCNNEVKGNYCPTCKKSLSLGGINPAAVNKAGPSSSTAHLNRSAAMEQKGTGPKVKDKTIDGFEKSNAVQSKYSSHLVAKDRASDFGNMTRSNRWRLAETIALALLALSTIIGLVSMFMPFFSGFTTSGDQTITGMGSIGFDYMGDAGASIGTMAMLSMICFGVTLVLSLIKLAAMVVPALGFMNKTPVAIAYAVLAVLSLVFAILVFSSVSAFVAKEIITDLILFEGGSGIGTLLLLIAGIGATVAGIAGALTRLKLNSLQTSVSGGKTKQASGPMV
ncbi:MAG: hypothetical protein FWF56_03145 [Firmicutes bacterium]|nr:hypothetical protein [Bacillota bacterium]